ncbi:MAG TPA: phosphatidate cytidylyltransferase [Alphaproteobacteria bacterium]|nr:phosphatidate cytidylyltransferase [Alphaproteobacteria bacterium]
MASFTGASDGTEHPSAPRRADLRARIISSVVLGPLVLAAVILGGIVFAALIFATAILSAREWVRLVAPEERELARELSYGFLLAALVIEVLIGPRPASIVLVALSVVLLIIVTARQYSHRRLIAFGIPYVGFAMVSLLWLRGQTDTGLALVLWLSISIWATDIGGYVAGRTIGGAKLAPRISPNKTWAGLFGAMTGAALFGGLVALIFQAEMPLLAAGVAAVLAMVAQMGDLFESAIKRKFGVKDSGRLIPGHGGMLDRIDGLIAAAPVLALFHTTLGGLVGWW